MYVWICKVEVIDNEKLTNEPTRRHIYMPTLNFEAWLCCYVDQERWVQMQLRFWCRIDKGS